MIVAVATQKGGSAKTTTVVNLGRARRAFPSDTPRRPGRTGPHDFLARRRVGTGKWAVCPGLAERKCRSKAVVHETAWPNLDVIPGNLALNHLRDRLDPAKRAADARVLREAFQEIAAPYAWVLLDCPAGLNSLTINALAAADRLLIPVAPPDSISTDGTNTC